MESPTRDTRDLNGLGARARARGGASSRAPVDGRHLGGDPTDQLLQPHGSDILFLHVEEKRESLARLSARNAGSRASGTPRASRYAQAEPDRRGTVICNALANSADLVHPRKCISLYISIHLIRSRAVGWVGPGLFEAIQRAQRIPS